MIPGRPLDRSEHREQLVMVGGDVSPGCLLFPRQEICIRKMHAPIELVVGIRQAIFFASYRGRHTHSLSLLHYESFTCAIIYILLYSSSDSHPCT